MGGRKPFVAVIGASGFVGQRLARRLSLNGVPVRCVVRRLHASAELEGLELVRCNLEEPRDRLIVALEGARTIYYLANSVKDGRDFAEHNRENAQRFVAAARMARVGRVIYLGTLIPARTKEPLTPLIESAREVGLILRRGIGALVIRSSMLIGPDSAGFEVMRGLAGHMPSMLTPIWTVHRCQPIYADDAVETLARATQLTGEREVDLAGPDIVTYHRILSHLADSISFRFKIPLPVASPALSARWLRFVTQMPLNVVRSVLESMRFDQISHGPSVCQEVGVEPLGFVESVSRSISSQPARLIERPRMARL